MTLDAKKFWRTANRVYERILTVVLVLILLIVLYCMYDNYWVYSHTIDNSILKFKPTAQGYTPEESPITDDMVAWLTIDGTNIDYPVMQGSDNVKYLNTDPFGKYSLSGSIFLDSRNSPDFSDDYSLVYGHHMEYGKMFGALDEFLNADYLQAHSTGELLIGKDGKEKHDLRVFASLRANAKDDEIFEVRHGGTAEFVKANAVVYTAEPTGKLLALSTCAEGDSLTRVVVLCEILD